MNERNEIRPECEHRITTVEALLSNHIPHVNARLDRIEKMLWGIAGAVFAGVIGLIFFMIKGHITF